MRKLILIFGLFFTINSYADVKNFECVFDKNTTSSNSVLNLNFIIDNASNKGYLVGELGVVSVQIIPNSYGVSFLEITDSGNIMSTTVSYETKKAVHSRNSVILGSLVPSQYYGDCIVK